MAADRLMADEHVRGGGGGGRGRRDRGADGRENECGGELVHLVIVGTNVTRYSASAAFTWI